MKFRHMLEEWGVRAQDIQVVTLATDGYSAAKHNLLLVCMAGWVEDLADIRPEYRMVGGGNVEATADITGILPQTYRLEAQQPEAVSEWLKGRISAATVLAGHAASRFSRPFLEKLLGESLDSVISGIFDTQTVGRIALSGRLTAGAADVNSLQAAQAKMAAMSAPYHQPKGLEAMCEAYELPLDYPGWPMAPWQKSCRTMALLNRLLEEEVENGD